MSILFSIFFKGYLAVVDAEHVAIQNLAAHTGRDEFDVSVAAIKIVAERDAIFEVQD